jgi:hypothetical protein
MNNIKPTYHWVTMSEYVILFSLLESNVHIIDFYIGVVVFHHVSIIESYEEMENALDYLYFCLG